MSIINRTITFKQVTGYTNPNSSNRIPTTAFFTGIVLDKFRDITAMQHDSYDAYLVQVTKSENPSHQDYVTTVLPSQILTVSPLPEGKPKNFEEWANQPSNNIPKMPYE